uniref:Uncharacterized protein n=1 Tax=Rhipicephalus zambeziensis TaxID=60191 RepID=A0A224YAJ5_9ACAR
MAASWNPCVLRGVEFVRAGDCYCVASRCVLCVAVTDVSASSSLSIIRGTRQIVVICWPCDSDMCGSFVQCHRRICCFPFKCYRTSVSSSAAILSR